MQITALKVSFTGKLRFGSPFWRQIHTKPTTPKNHTDFYTATKKVFTLGNALIMLHYFIYGSASFYGYVHWKKELFMHR